MRSLFFLGIALMVVLGPAARGVEKPPAADDFYRAAVRLQTAGERSAVPQLSVDFYRQAAGQYREAVRLKPDLQPAQYSLAVCLQRLARQASTSAEKVALVRAARQQFAVAANCPGADWRTYSVWGTFLLWEASNVLKETGERRAVLQEAQHVFEQGLTKVTFTSERGEFEINLGICLVLLGRVGTTTEERMVLFRRAVNYFDSVAKMERLPRPGRVYGWWGVAKLEIAKLTGSHLGAWQAIELLQTALEKDPDDLQNRYNLVCAYALIDEQEKAMRELRALLDRDTKRQFYKTAADDTDLNSLRRTAEFNALFVPDPAIAAVLAPSYLPNNDWLLRGKRSRITVLPPSFAPISDR